MDTALPTTAEACRDRLRALAVEARALSAEIERITAKQLGESELADRLPAVIKEVCGHWPLIPSQLIGRDNRHQVVEARDTCWLLLSEMAGSSLSAIGRAFSDRDHSTITYGINQVTAWAARDRRLAAKILECRIGLQGFTAADLVAR